MCTYYDMDNVIRRVVPIYCIYICDLCKYMAFFMTRRQIKDVTNQGLKKFSEQGLINISKQSFENQNKNNIPSGATISRCADVLHTLFKIAAEAADCHHSTLAESIVRWKLTNLKDQSSLLPLLLQALALIFFRFFA